jgi:hypothetical protein
VQYVSTGERVFQGAGPVLRGESTSGAGSEMPEVLRKRRNALKRFSGRMRTKLVAGCFEFLLF